MNAVTGQISWTPDTVGNYIQSFIIDEYKNGVQVGSMIRDMQYVVVPQGSNSSPLFMQITPYLTNPTQDYNYAYYDPEQPFSFQIQGVDPDNNNLQMQCFSELLTGANPATFTVAGAANNIIGTFNWIPSLNATKDILVVFRVRDGIFSQDFTLLLRKNPNPTNVKNASSMINNLVVYPNPAKNKLNISVDLQKDINSDISLFNSLGQNVSSIYQGKLKKGNNILTQNLDLPAGIYHMVVKDNGAVIKTVRVAVQ
jgi:hypothetical protein